MSSRSAVRSPAFSLAMKVPRCWPMNGGEHLRPDLAAAAAEQAPVGLPADDDQPPVRGEGAAQPGEPGVAADVEDDVVAAAAVGEIRPGVVEDGWAPSARTMLIFAVLATPVTSAPNAFAICTANVPTPPDAPMISTFCPARIRP